MISIIGNLPIQRLLFQFYTCPVAIPRANIGRLFSSGYHQLPFQCRYLPRSTTLCYSLKAKIHYLICSCSWSSSRGTCARLDQQYPGLRRHSGCFLGRPHANNDQQTTHTGQHSTRRQRGERYYSVRLCCCIPELVCYQKFYCYKLPKINIVHNFGIDNKLGTYVNLLVCVYKFNL